ncbi:MAG: porin family protein [Fibrobacterota bacterium]
MKHNVLAVAALLLFISLQTAGAADLSILPKAGISLGNIWGDDADDLDADMLVAPIGGAALEIALTEQMSIQPELLYSMKGFKVEEEQDFMGEIIEYSSTVKVSYLEIPVYGKFSFTAEGVQPFVYAGPALGIRLAATQEWEAGDDEGDDDIKDDTAPINFGIAGGFGVAIPAGAGKVVVDGGYTLGLTEIHDTDEGSSDIKSNNINFSVGYAIPIGR